MGLDCDRGRRHNHYLRLLSMYFIAVSVLYLCFSINIKAVLFYLKGFSFSSDYSTFFVFGPLLSSMRDDKFCSTIIFVFRVIMGHFAHLNEFVIVCDSWHLSYVQSMCKVTLSAVCAIGHIITYLWVCT